MRSGGQEVAGGGQEAGVLNPLLSSMRPETSLLGVTTVQGGGGASLRAQDREQGRGLGWTLQHSTLKPNSTSNSSFLHFYYRGYETRIKGDLYNYKLRKSYYSCDVRQDRVMGGRECRDFISL